MILAPLRKKYNSKWRSVCSVFPCEERSPALHSRLSIKNPLSSRAYNFTISRRQKRTQSFPTVNIVTQDIEQDSDGGNCIGSHVIIRQRLPIQEIGWMKAARDLAREKSRENCRGFTPQSAVH